MRSLHSHPRDDEGAIRLEDTVITKALIIALSAMFLQQTCATMGRATVPVVAPAAVGELGVDPALVGVFIGLAALAGFVTTIGCGGFILRWGAVRMTQIGMTSLAIGLGAAASGFLSPFVLAAILVGIGSAVSTPASSHLLVRYASPRQAPLVFSIKQTGVPAGLMLSGVLVPFLVPLVGWQGSLLVMAALCLGVALPMQAMRTTYDADRNPAQPLSIGDIKQTLMEVLSNPGLRVMGIASFSFVGLQSLFSGFLILYLVEGLGHDLRTAGSVFATGMAGSAVARIFWGWIAGNFVEPRLLLALLGGLMAVAAVLTALLSPDWSLPAVMAVAVMFSVTAVSWHGVLLAEVARLATPGKVGGMTGGVLAFGDAAAFIMPLVFSALLALTGSYGIGYAVAGIPALGIALYLGFGGRPKKDEVKT